MSLYSEAAAAIATAREATQAELDALAAKARQDHITALRADLRMAGDTPEAAVRNLLAETISVGNHDGYPRYRIPDDTKAVLRAAIEAGVISTNGTRVDIGGVIGLFTDSLSLATEHDAHTADVAAWTAADDYRKRQKTSL
jgi:hypothetical protein